MYTESGVFIYQMGDIYLAHLREVNLKEGGGLQISLPRLVNSSWMVLFYDGIRSNSHTIIVGNVIVF